MDVFQKAINDALNAKLRKFKERLKFDYTIVAKVLSFDETNNLYIVLYNGAELQVKAREGLILKVNDLVYIRVIQGDFSNKFIDCKKP